MSIQVPNDVKPIEYPDSDGQPMAENTKQFRWIVTLQGNLDAMFRDDPNIFVAGDLLWYPVEGDNVTRTAPDAMVIWGRPKGDRGSYQQWKENGIAPQVVFEVLSPGNRSGEMVRKFHFYEKFGVEEYYVYDPDNNMLEGWIRRGGSLVEITDMRDWVSPRLAVRFDPSGVELRLFTPDGRPFSTFLQLAEEREREWQRAEQERQRADQLEAQLKSLRAEPES